MNIDFNERPNEASRPFDKERAGLILGDGAGALLLESLEHVDKRKATGSIWAEVVGYSCNNNAAHLTRNGYEDIIRCMSDLLKRS